MKASIIFFPWTAKKSSKTGKTPLYMRVNFNGSKTETRLNAELTEGDLLLWDEFTMRFKDRKHPLNGYLNALDKQFADFRILNATTHSKYTAQDLRDYIIGVSPKEKEFTLIEYIDKYYQSTVLPNTGVAIGTKKNYKKAINHFKSFPVEKNLTSLVMRDLSVSLAFDFKDYLLSSSPDGKKIGLTGHDPKKIQTTIFYNLINFQIKTTVYRRFLSLITEMVRLWSPSPDRATR